MSPYGKPSCAERSGWRVGLMAAPMAARPNLLPSGLANLTAILGTSIDLSPTAAGSTEAAFALGRLTILAFLGWEKFRPQSLAAGAGRLDRRDARSLCSRRRRQAVFVPESLVDAIKAPGWQRQAIAWNTISPSRLDGHLERGRDRRSANPMAVRGRHSSRPVGKRTAIAAAVPDDNGREHHRVASNPGRSTVKRTVGMALPRTATRSSSRKAILAARSSAAVSPTISGAP